MECVIDKWISRPSMTVVFGKMLLSYLQHISTLIIKRHLAQIRVSKNSYNTHIVLKRSIYDYLFHVSVNFSRMFFSSWWWLIIKAKTFCTLDNKHCPNGVVIVGFIIHVSILRITTGCVTQILNGMYRLAELGSEGRITLKCIRKVHDARCDLNLLHRESISELKR